MKKSVVAKIAAAAKDGLDASMHGSVPEAPFKDTDDVASFTTSTGEAPWGHHLRVHIEMRVYRGPDVDVDAAVSKLLGQVRAALIGKEEL